jgi:hypothetical protein
VGPGENREGARAFLAALIRTATPPTESAVFPPIVPDMVKVQPASKAETYTPPPLSAAVFPPISPPGHDEDAVINTYAAASPLILNFQEGERGKRNYMAGRWALRRGGAIGSFGDIGTAVVP